MSGSKSTPLHTLQTDVPQDTTAPSDAVFIQETLDIAGADQGQLQPQQQQQQQQFQQYQQPQPQYQHQQPMMMPPHVIHDVFVAAPIQMRPPQPDTSFSYDNVMRIIANVKDVKLAIVVGVIVAIMLTMPVHEFVARLVPEVFKNHAAFPTAAKVVVAAIAVLLYRNAFPV